MQKISFNYQDWIHNKIFLPYWTEQSRQMFTLHQEKLSTTTIIGIWEENVPHPQLVDLKKVLLTPLQIKVCLMKDFLKGMGKTKTEFMYLQNTFPRISELKITERICFGYWLLKFFWIKILVGFYRKRKKNAWKCFQVGAKEFAGNKKAENYRKLVEDVLKAYK